jgi:hypothetical protein
MKDALNQQIKVGDYVAYAHRRGMMIVRVSRLEEYRLWRGDAKVRIVGKYAMVFGREWMIMNGGHVRPLRLPNHALVISSDRIPDSLAALLA